MSAPNVIRAADGEAVAVARRQADHELLESALTARGVAHVALAGGTTPGAMYAQLIAHDRWDGVELWFGDERCVGPDDPESNYRMVAETLLPHARRRAVPPDRGGIGSAGRCERLRRAAGRARAQGRRPAAGARHRAARNRRGRPHCVAVPAQPGARSGWGVVRAVHDAPKPPPDRVSLSLEVLRAARSVILLAAGSGKAAALRARSVSRPHYFRQVCWRGSA
jgi:6-phosphogluconolactonase